MGALEGRRWSLLDEIAAALERSDAAAADSVAFNLAEASDLAALGLRAELLEVLDWEELAETERRGAAAAAFGWRRAGEGAPAETLALDERPF